MADLTYDTQEAVPEDLRENAENKDGKFVVSVSPTKKVTEFRDSNLSLSRERDGANATIAKIRTDFGYDPEKHDEFKATLDGLRTTDQQVRDGKLVKDTSLDDAVQKRTGEMQRQHQAQVDGLTTNNTNLTNENKELRLRLDNMEIDTRVGAAAAMETSGLRVDAIEAVKDAARKVFQMRDGKLIPIDADGNIIYGSDGTKPMEPLEWIKTKLAQSSPFFFKESSGGGSGGGRGNGAPGGLKFGEGTPQERMRQAREQQGGR